MQKSEKLNDTILENINKNSFNIAENTMENVIFFSKFATKDDIKDLKNDLSVRIEKLEQTLVKLNWILITGLVGIIIQLTFHFLKL